MHGSLALHRGVVYVGRCAKTAWVATYDLDGHRLEGGFAFRDAVSGRSSAAGLAVDADRRVWVADAAAGRVRAFTLFGRALVDVADPDEGEDDRHGALGRPVDVDVQGSDEDLRVAVASAGRRRHALHVFEPASGRVLGLRPADGPRGTFADLRGVSWGGDRLYACERGAVRVYREGALHWSLRLPVAGAGRFRPSAAAALTDGRIVVANADPEAGSVLLCDPNGQVRRVLAEGGEDTGRVVEPLDVVVDEEDEGGPRAVVIDQAGERVQVFGLEGRCFGAFPRLTGTREA